MCLLVSPMSLHIELKEGINVVTYKKSNSALKLKVTIKYQEICHVAVSNLFL